jgi:nitrous oxide reductase accessory protein NosL
MNVFVALMVVAGCALCLNPAYALTMDLPDGSKLDMESICPVCEMKVESGMFGPSAAVMNDGKVIGFDSTGELFRWLHSPEKYGFDPKNVKSMYVTEHGNPQKFMDAKEAVYVVGSELSQEMGPEPAAFKGKEDAQAFKTRHKGRDVVEFAKVTAEDVKSKKKLLKMKHDH